LEETDFFFLTSGGASGRTKVSEGELDSGETWLSQEETWRQSQNFSFFA
jgi:hypothetical protein